MILWTALTLYPVLHTFYGVEEGIFPFKTFRATAWGQLNLFLFFPYEMFTVQLLYGAWIFFSITLITGLWSRFSAFALWMILTSFHHRNIHVLNSGDTLIRVLVFFMIFAPVGATGSLDRCIRILRGKDTSQPKTVSIWGARLLQVQFAWVYICAAIFKLQGESWTNGTALSMVLKIPEFQTLNIPWIIEPTWISKLMTLSSILVEAALGYLIWLPSFRLPLVIIGILFHLSIEALMFVPVFEWIMISGLLLFVDSPVWHKVFEKFRARKPEKVLYDRDCVFCTRWMHVLVSLDFRKSFHWEGSPQATEEAVLITYDGRTLGGFFAFRRIALKIPALWPLLPMFYFPGSAWVGTRVYKWIADHRYVFMGKSCDL